MPSIRLEQGDCLDLLRALEPGSVDAVVTDPPYGLGSPPPMGEVLAAWLAGEPYRPKGRGFMGKSWDAFVPGPEVWRECLRVLKPGGHLLAFFGSRTIDVGGLAIRLAGFEIRDQVAWLYGTGFPKSLDVSKAIDAAAGAEREVVGSKYGLPGYSLAPSKGATIYGGGIGGTGDPEKEAQITAPATPEAAAWEGWGTALKPAHEPIIVARKPLAARSVAAQVLASGTGALHIDACRIPTSEEDARAMERCNTPGSGRFKTGEWAGGGWPAKGQMDCSQGRWPANAALDGGAAALLDAQAGRASRFFYCAKASKADRGTGNAHPTVKPQALMRWLVRLVAPPGAVILDPFAGSGSTLLAAREEGFDAIGFEREPEYVQIARQRLGLDAPSGG